MTLFALCRQMFRLNEHHKAIGTNKINVKKKATSVVDHIGR